MKFLERSFDQQNQFWKYFLVILGGFVGGQLVGAIPLMIVVVFKIVSNGGTVVPPANVADLTAFGISQNVGLLLIMIPFIISLIFIVLLIKFLHKRTFAETVNGTKKIRINRCLTGAAVWAVLMALYLCGDYLINRQDYILQFDLAKFIPLLIISVVFIPFQTTVEELLFRGYLTQGFARLTKNRWLAILIPGLLFALMHASNPEVKAFGFWNAMPQYIFLGLLWGLVAILDDGIELSIGMHTANNIFLSLFITHQSSALQTDAVFEQINLNLTKDTIMLIAIGIIAFAYFAIKYKWDFNILKVREVNIMQP